jgi:hypothetical protein
MVSAMQLCARRRQQMVYIKIVRALAAIALLGALLGPRTANPQAPASENGASSSKLRGPAKRALELQNARQRVLSILQDENGCSAWFREADPDPAGVFESLQIEIGKGNREVVLRTIDRKGDRTYKHPWGARSNQLAGRNSIVELNPAGPFFVLSLPIMQVSAGGFVSYEGSRILTVGGFAGDTREVQIVMLLHELAHVTGRIPEDDDSWDGRSTRNSEEVARNCKNEIQIYAQR